MTLWASADIAAGTGGVASAAFTVTGVSFDSREVCPGDLFVAMPGTATDGHSHVGQAYAQHASGTLVSRPVDGPHILVADTADALDALGMAARRRTGAKIAGITGSVGKTGTKEALAAALARKPDTKVHRSVKSYNNHTGVPLSLARMPEASDYGVFEMGMNHAGELAALTRLVRPHVAVVTAIAPAHIEFFPDGLQGIADAKAEIFQGLEPGGTAIIPFDSPWRDRLIKRAKSYAARILTFGLGEGADVRAHHAIEGPEGTSASVVLPDAELTLTIGLPGAHWVSNGLAVLAVVHALGADLSLAALALADLEELPGRGARVRLPLPAGEALLIDESYNANPTSMAATLNLLGAQPASRRIAVLGAMRELGSQSDELHAALANDVIAASVDFALLVGEGIGALAEALEGTTDVAHVADAATAHSVLAAMIAPGDAILIKGSNAVGLSALVAQLKFGTV